MSEEDVRSELADLRARLEKIESGNFSGRKIICSGISVRDESNNSRFVVALSENGEPLACMSDRNNQIRIALNVVDTKGEIAIFDDDEEALVTIKVTDENSGQLLIENGSNQALFGVGEHGDEERSVFGAVLGLGNETKALFQIDDGRAGIVFLAPNEQVLLTADESAGGALLWTDNDGRVFKAIDSSD